MTLDAPPASADLLARIAVLERAIVALSAEVESPAPRPRVALAREPALD